MNSSALVRYHAKSWMWALPLAAGIATAFATDPTVSDTATSTTTSGEHGTPAAVHRPVKTRAVYHPSAKRGPGDLPPGLTMTSREAPRPVVIYESAAPNPGEVLYLNDDPAVAHPMTVAARIAPAPVPAPTESTEIRRATIVPDDATDQAATDQAPPPRAEIVGPPDPPTPPPTTRSASTSKKGIDVTKLPVAQYSKTSWYRVVSPFPPYHELDVSGFASGEMARDPASGKLFRLP